MNPDIAHATDCYNSYFNFAVFDKQITIDGVDVKVRFDDKGTHIVFPGSYTMLDWQRDLASIRETLHPQLGLIGEGFGFGADDLYNVLQPIILKDKPIYIKGHSLGAARAVIQAGKFLASGISGSQIDVIVFGCPNPGGMQLANMVAKVNRIACYRNGNDPVTSVPTALMGAVPPPHIIQIGSEPVASLDRWPIAICFHHIQAYIVSLAIQSV